MDGRMGERQHHFLRALAQGRMVVGWRGKNVLLLSTQDVLTGESVKSMFDQLLIAEDKGTKKLTTVTLTPRGLEYAKTV